LNHFQQILKICWIPQFKPVWWAPLLSDLNKEGDLNAWSQKCMKCPQVGCGGVFTQIISSWFQTCSSHTAFRISCMNKVKKCFSKGFGWICALNRWSVQERTHISFCPIALQVFTYLARELCRQIAAYILSRLTPFYKWMGSERGVWGEGPFWAGGLKFARDCHVFF